MNRCEDLWRIGALRAPVGQLRPHRSLAYNLKPGIHTGLALRARADIPYVALITGRGALERRPGLKGAGGTMPSPPSTPGPFAEPGFRQEPQVRGLPARHPETCDLRARSTG